MVPLKNLDNSYKSKSYVKKDCTPDLFKINLIEHDHLRLCENEMAGYMKDSIFIIDEVHKALSDTKRTSVALQFSHLSKEFIALTGTPIIDSDTYKLVWWLEQIVPFEVNRNNFWVAANDMISKKFVTGVKVIHENIYVGMSDEEDTEYKKYVPPAIGGKNQNPKPNDFQTAMNICYKIVNKGIINIVKKYLDRGVFVVAKDSKHQEELLDLIMQNIKIRREDIFLITSKDTLFLTDASVENKKTKDYKIVITTVRKSAGYTLTRLTTMVTSVYPSNNADREQLEGRINRIGQKSKDVIISTVHTGILTYIMQKHMDAKNLSAVLSALASDIQFKGVLK